MSDHPIHIQGAGQHNLRQIDVTLPSRKMTVFSGVSGSGKSSLALDTIYAEGRRRYVESLSTYARQFLGQLERPKYAHIHGLTPTIAVSQDQRSNNPRSTVGTITEIHDFLRVLFAQMGTQHCTRCHQPIGRADPDAIHKRIVRLPEGTRFSLLAPVPYNTLQHDEIIQKIRSEGYSRIRIGGQMLLLEDPIPESPDDHLEIVVDRLIARPGNEARILDSIETAFRVGRGRILLLFADGREERFTEQLECPDCNLTFPPLTPTSFSFNSPQGCCPECSGLGTVLRIDLNHLIPDPSLSLRQGAIQAMGFGRLGQTSQTFKNITVSFPELDLDAPWNALPKTLQEELLKGHAPHWEGIENTLLRRLKETQSELASQSYQELLCDAPCPQCGGTRLRPESAAVRIGELNLPELEALQLSELRDFIKNLSQYLPDAELIPELQAELSTRIDLVCELGLGYLTLDRLAPSLSGGESQRLRLAGQIGGELSGVTYVLDEPSTGLHPYDRERLIAALHRLRDAGNTVLVVEHDSAFLRAADHIVDFGPGPGVLGGRIVAQGSIEDLCKSPESVTGAWLSGQKQMPRPEKPRKPSGKHLKLIGARGHNLKNIDLDLPLGLMIGLSGLSGSGKSSLVDATLYPALAQHFYRSTETPLPFDRIEGVENIDKIVRIDQAPIGKSPRSNAATYTGAFDFIRELFAQTREARAYGFSANRFSFNVKGGRCEVCHGDGQRKIEMHFLPDVQVPCEACDGKRFNEATLRIQYNGYNIAEILNFSCSQAAEFFVHHPRLSRILGTLRDVGLGYLTLGQPANTLSGGEAQRIKLARELAREEQGRSLYVLDEPSRGLHPEDLSRLCRILHALVDRGNTVLIIEHQLDLLWQTDWLIDLGPGAGKEGGQIVVQGPPQKVAACPKSVTGQYLTKHLEALSKA